MSASLVGSEMCIRDRSPRSLPLPVAAIWGRLWSGLGRLPTLAQEGLSPAAVRAFTTSEAMVVAMAPQSTDCATAGLPLSAAWPAGGARLLPKAFAATSFTAEATAVAMPSAESLPSAFWLSGSPNFFL
eukprot:13583705-Alexandrium_andersonii.AAC.1